MDPLGGLPVILRSSKAGADLSGWGHVFENPSLEVTPSKRGPQPPQLELMHRIHEASIAPLLLPLRTKNPDEGADFASQDPCQLPSP